MIFHCTPMQFRLSFTTSDLFKLYWDPFKACCWFSMGSFHGLVRC